MIWAVGRPPSLRGWAGPYEGRAEPSPSHLPFCLILDVWLLRLHPRCGASVHPAQAEGLALDGQKRMAQPTLALDLFKALASLSARPKKAKALKRSYQS